MYIACILHVDYASATRVHCSVHPSAASCDMVSHQTIRARRVQRDGMGGEVRHGVTSGVSYETSET